MASRVHAIISQIRSWRYDYIPCRTNSPLKQAVFLYTRIGDNARLRGRETSRIIDVMVTVASQGRGFELRQLGATGIRHGHLCLGIKLCDRA